MKNGWLLSIFFFSVIIFGADTALAVDFNGTAFNEFGAALNNTLVNVTVRNMMDFSIADSYATYSNASGSFNLTMPSNDSWMYEPSLRHSNGSVVDYIGQSLPAFPYQVLSEVSGTSFFLLEAGTINITAVNSSGDRTSFNYQIKDTKLGYPVASNMEEMDMGGTNEAIVYVPRGRNYSIMLFPNMSMPATFNWNNFSSATSYSFDGGLSSYNSTTYTVQKQFNMTMGHGRVSGYIEVPGISGWDDFSVVSYLLEPGDMVHSSFGTIPYNLSSFFEVNGSDYYNLSTGITNFSGFYNISLPSTVELSEMILFAVARNGTTYYGGFHNLSLDYSNYSNGESLPLNFTYMFGLLGAEGNISVEDPIGGANVMVATRLQEFAILNSSNDTVRDLFAHVEADVDYSDYGVKPFTWMSNIEQGSNSSFSIPLLNVTGLEEMNVFAGGGDYAPVSESWSVTKIMNEPNITLNSFSPQDLSGNVGQGSSSIQISLYTSNSTCDVPSPSASCLVGSSEGMDTFNPMKAIMGGGKLSFRMGVGDVLIHYVNVDMLASGPPDALFEDDSSVNENTGDGFDKAMRFGSGGPTIYDFVLVSMPYTEGSTSTTGLDESNPINMSIPTLYDEDWNVIWNVSINGSNGTELGNNISHYNERSTEWETLMSETTCTENATLFNATTPCYVNKTENQIWIRLPHFSGTGPAISGSVITANSGGGGSSGGGGGGGGSSISLSPSTEALKSGYDIGLLKSYIVTLNVEGEKHTLRLTNITSSEATITITSDPVTLHLKPNETKKVDVTGDGYYDIQVFLKSIAYPRARVVITSIREAIPGTAETNTGEEEREETERGSDTRTEEGSDRAGEKSSAAKTTKKQKIVWTIIALLIIIAVAYIVWTKKKK